MSHHYPPQPKWMQTLKVGDVLREGSGTMRVVRNVSRWSGRLKYVTFTIRRCSWTGRCYTVVTASDLRVRGFRPVPVKRRPLRSDFDRKIHQSIHGNEMPGHYTLKCCDVEGVA